MSVTQDFLAPQNQCGKTLLSIVARGSAILAEMQRLSQHVPKIFINPTNKYQKVIYDFQYFKNMNEIQTNIQQDTELVQINESIKNTYLPLLERFYKLFQSIYTYYDALMEFINQIQTGVFMSFSFQNILQIVDGKQLICQAFYLFGVMLLLLDQLIQGPVRQRIVLCYYRNKGGENISRINQVRTLVTDTGFRWSMIKNQEYQRPEKYPQEYFARFPIIDQIMESIILAIKDDDIYKQMAAYPKPDLRSFALANQSSMIFILLFFMPKALNNSRSAMREIVDKHFYNCWVLPYYLGYTVDLTYWWKPYKAAKMALGNILDQQSITEITQLFVMKQTEYYRKCKQFLTEGVMNQQFVLNKINSLMNCLREANISLRWLMLHRKTTNQKLREIVHNASNPTDILRLMLVVAQFENILKQKCVELISKKQQLWDFDKDNCAQRMRELSIYFGGQQSLGKIQSDQSFKIWFNDMYQAIKNLAFTNSTFAGRKIQDLIKALEDIEQYHQIASSIQIKQYLHDTRNDLDHMVKVINVNRYTLTSIDIICDITWSWMVIKDYIKLMQKQVRKNPDIALLLKNTFTKLSSILNTPMIRIMQANSPDMQSVSKFYSNQLVKIVKKVLQIIPQSVFQLLGSIINIFTTKMQSQPQKFDKAQLIKYAQFQNRLVIAKYTHQISVFAQSIIGMESYLLGVVQVDPKVILQDGVRRQLIRLIAKILQQNLSVQFKAPQQFNQRIMALATTLKSFKLSLQYIQDFIHIYGLKMFYEQFQKLIYSYVDMQKVALVQNRTGIQQLSYDQDLPLPTISNDKFNTFMGATLLELLNLTSSKRNTFLLTSYGFYNIQTHKQSLTLKSVHLLQQCIGVSGLQGLDHLLCFKIMQSMKKIMLQINNICVDSVKKTITNCYLNLKNVSSFSERYSQAVNTLKKTLKSLCILMSHQFIKIGQYVLLRDMLCLQLRMLAKVGSNRLYLVLQNINNALMNDISSRVHQPVQNQEQIINQNLLLKILNPYFAHVGMLQPTKKIYITAKEVDNLPLIIFATLATNISLIDYDKSLKSLIRANKKDYFEPNYFLSGLLSFMHQFHPTTKLSFYAYTASYIKSTINFIMINKQVGKNPELIGDLFTYIRFLEEAIKYSRQPYEKYKQIIDLGLFASLDKQTLKQGYRLN